MIDGWGKKISIVVVSSKAPSNPIRLIGRLLLAKIPLIKPIKFTKITLHYYRKGTVIGIVPTIVLVYYGSVLYNGFIKTTRILREIKWHRCDNVPGVTLRPSRCHVYYLRSASVYCIQLSLLFILRLLY